jgi:SAM-dependent methyltransferase
LHCSANSRLLVRKRHPVYDPNLLSYANLDWRCDVFAGGTGRRCRVYQTMKELLPARLRTLWQAVEDNRITADEFQSQQERWMDEHKQLWQQALLLDGYTDLRESLLSELGRYLGISDLAELQRRCQEGVLAVASEWKETFQQDNARSVERFYDQSQAYLYDLVGWHTLADDNSPLAYVLALQFALEHGCRHHLDFGAGVGSGSLLFARHGFGITLADISTTLLQFSRWRLDIRGLQAQMIDLKTAPLPSEAFDIITAMDVFEHLVDPVETIAQLWDALKPGGFLFGRFDADQDPDHPQHIVRDFAPTFKRMKELGLVEMWRDDWLWGHQVFRKE